MVKSLINKCPSVKFGPWISDYTKSIPLLTEFPEDVDIVEIYIYMNSIDLFLPGNEDMCASMDTSHRKLPLARSKQSSLALKNLDYNSSSLRILTPLLQ